MNNQLPKDWKWVKLGEVCDIRSGKNQKAVQSAEGKFPIYGSSGIFGYANEYLCEAGTTVVGRKGTINSPLYVNEKFWNVDTAFGLYPKDDFDKKLFYYFCKSFNFHKLILDYSQFIMWWISWILDRKLLPSLIPSLQI